MPIFLARPSLLRGRGALPPIGGRSFPSGDSVLSPSQDSLRLSCKARGVCPSCAGRRMANAAAHLVDRVLPAVPVRQSVL